MPTGEPQVDVASARLLVVEDDEPSRKALVRSLERHGYDVLEAEDGEVALDVMDRRGRDIDLVVLDVGLPQLDGFAVLSRLRQTTDVPVIMLTGRAEEVDRVVGLELGADDYVLKPYSLRELVARVRARLRRSGSSGGADGAAPAVRADVPEGVRMEFGDVCIDRRAREVHVGGQLVELTAREYELLAFLAAHPRTVFSREELLEHVWGTRYQDPATVTEHVRRVRSKVEGRPPGRRLVTTLRGMGYRFDP